MTTLTRVMCLLLGSVLCTGFFYFGTETGAAAGHAVAVAKVSTPATTDVHGFIPNLGQWDHPARFVARFGPMTAFIEEGGWTMAISQEERSARPLHRENPLRGPLREGRLRHESRAGMALALRMGLTGSQVADISGEEVLAGVHNFYLGNDQSRWRTGVKAYGKVLFKGLCPGVDLQLRRSKDKLEYDLLLELGAEASQVEIQVEGNTDLRIDPDGSLVIETGLGDIRQAAPLTWEVAGDGEKMPVSCTYLRRGPHAFGFQPARRSPGLTLVIDPVLDFSTYIGTSSSDEYPEGVVVDGTGQATMVASVPVTGYPTTPGAWSTTLIGNSDTVVTRFNPTGTALVYSTYLGGTNHDSPGATAQDRQGNLFIFGTTWSSDFPITTNALNTTLRGQGDAFFTKLDTTGGVLLYSTYLGGTGDEFGIDIDMKAAGTQATLTGVTDSPDFPVSVGAYCTTPAGKNDIFVTRLDLTGTPRLSWSTYLGTTDDDQVFGVAEDWQGNAYITGSTSYFVNVPTVSFPTTPGAYDVTFNGGMADAFVTCINNTGTGLVYSTFMGGNSMDEGKSITVDRLGRAFVFGTTYSTDLPTTPGCLSSNMETSAGSCSTFVSCFDPTGSTLLWSTYLGGSGIEGAIDMDIDLQGNPLVMGLTTSSDFPTTPNAFSRRYQGSGDHFITSFTGDGSKLRYSSYLGGSGGESWWGAVATDLIGSRICALCGTASTDFPFTAGAFNHTHNGGWNDIALACATIEPAGFSVYGNSTPACAGRIGVYCLETPRAGNLNFCLACVNTPPSSTGLFLMSRFRLPGPIQVLGFDMWLDLSNLVINLPVASNNAGEGVLPLPIPAGTTGAHLFGQFIWLNTAACGGAGTLSASEPMEITVQ